MIHFFFLDPGSQPKIGKLVVRDVDAANPKQGRKQHQGAGTVRDADGRPLTENDRRHLQHADAETSQFGQAVLPVMTADLRILQARHIRQFADLEAVPGGQDDFAVSPFQLPDNGLKERNVRGVLEIDPDLPAWPKLCHGMHSGVGFRRRRALLRFGRF